jgi:glycerophosphoryl diester phosphodiesterase
MAAYQLAIDQCADYIEPDLVSTKDGVLVARHENEISRTTDVAARKEFADRRTTKVIDGARVTGWFTEDFSLAELQTLNAIERIPSDQPLDVEVVARHHVPTFEDVVDLASRSRTCTGERVGVYPETKRPTYFASIGLPLEDRMLAVLESYGYGEAGSPVYIQSSETSNLRQLDEMTDLPLVQLIGCAAAPRDLVVAGDRRTYDDLITRDGLKQVAEYADGVGVCKDRLIPRDDAGNLLRPTRLIRRAHRLGLEVHAWTFDAVNGMLPSQFRSSADPRAVGDLVGEIDVFLAAGIDGFFTDHPDLGVAAVKSD